MTLTPKHIIYIAVSNYLNEDINNEIKNVISKNKTMTSKKFIELIEKYFDFKIFRDKSIIPEDIWLYNYLMYDNVKTQKLFEVGEKVNVTKGFRKTALIKKYENKIILPQIKALIEANKILDQLS